MENATVFQSNIWWHKLGKWQVLVSLLTLVTFFVVLHFADDKKKAITFAIIAVDIVVIVAIILTTRLHLSLALAAAISVMAASIIDTTIFYIVITSLVVAIAATTLNNREGKRHGLSQRVVWLSCAVEFVLILLPMLLIRSI